MKKLIIALVAISAVAAQGALVNGDIFNVDYATNVGTASGAGVAGSAGDVWNVKTGTGVTGGNTKADGTAVAVSTYAQAAVGSSGAGFWGPGSGTDALMEDYAYLTDGGGSGAGDTVGGIATAASQRMTVFDGASVDLNTTQAFDLTFMGSDNNGTGFGIILKQSDGLGGFTYVNQVATGKLWTADPTYEQGVNYITFSGVQATSFGATGSEFEFWLYKTSATEGDGASAALNGLQLVAVPEPATIGLLAAFGGAMVFIRRKFSI